MRKYLDLIVADVAPVTYKSSPKDVHMNSKQQSRQTGPFRILRTNVTGDFSPDRHF